MLGSVSLRWRAGAFYFEGAGEEEGKGPGVSKGARTGAEAVFEALEGTDENERRGVGACTEPAPTPLETQAPKQDRANAHLPGLTSGEASSRPPGSVRLFDLWSHSHKLSARAGDPRDRCHAVSCGSHCQTQASPAHPVRDVEEHTHKATSISRPPSGLMLLFLFVYFPNYVELRDHMKEKHSMGFLCLACALCSSPPKDVSTGQLRSTFTLLTNKDFQSFNGDSAYRRP